MCTEPGNSVRLYLNFPKPTLISGLKADNILSVENWICSAFKVPLVILSALRFVTLIFDASIVPAVILSADNWRVLKSVICAFVTFKFLLSL